MARAGNDNDGWTYVSKDGGTIFFSGKSEGENGKPFDSLQDFVKDDLAQYYDTGYRIETTTEEDQVVLEAAQEKQAENYGTSGECNCTAVPKAALEEIGVETTKNWSPSTLENDINDNTDFQKLDIKAMTTQKVREEEKQEN